MDKYPGMGWPPLEEVGFLPKLLNPRPKCLATLTSEITRIRFGKTAHWRAISPISSIPVYSARGMSSSDDAAACRAWAARLAISCLRSGVSDSALAFAAFDARSLVVMLTRFNACRIH